MATVVPGRPATTCTRRTPRRVRARKAVEVAADRDDADTAGRHRLAPHLRRVRARARCRGRRRGPMTPAPRRAARPCTCDAVAWNGSPRAAEATAHRSARYMRCPMPCQCRLMPGRRRLRRRGARRRPPATRRRGPRPTPATSKPSGAASSAARNPWASTGRVRWRSPRPSTTRSPSGRSHSSGPGVTRTRAGGAVTGGSTGPSRVAGWRRQISSASQARTGPDRAGRAAPSSAGRPGLGAAEHAGRERRPQAGVGEGGVDGGA